MLEIKILSPKTLKLWLEKDEAILIDVREPHEYKEHYIKKAINIPLSELIGKINEIPEVKKKKLVLQCKAGIRSMIGCQALEKDGFNATMWNLEGGIDAWANSGLPIVQK